MSSSPEPPIAGMPLEVWHWLRESTHVRPHVVARVRAALDAGHRPTPDQVAVAILDGRGRGVHLRPFLGVA